MNSSHSIEKGSPERFGHSWDIYREILPIHEEQFLRWTEGLDKTFWEGKSFLDVGCGIGRNSFWPMRYGASEGLCIDVDQRTLAVARKNLEGYTSVRLDYRSAYEINEADRFDISFSIGVIHHLEKPELAITEMVKATKPGGKVLVWLYGYENNEWITKYFNPLRKALFSKLPLSVTHFFSMPLTILLWLILKAGLGKTRYFDLLRQLSFSHLRAIVYDHMIPETARYFTRDEAAQLLAQAGLKSVETHHVNDMSWTVIGSKP